MTTGAGKAETYDVASVQRRTVGVLVLSQALGGLGTTVGIAVAAVLAEEALQWATVAENDWECARASRAKAMTGSTSDELVELVDWAASLLEDVGNVVGLGQLLCNAAYSALCMGADGYASELVGVGVWRFWWD